MAYLGYLTSEVVEDWTDGLIPRREALRRLALLGLTASAAATALVAGSASAQSPSPVAGAPAGSAAPAAPPTPPGMPGIPGTDIVFPGPNGGLLGHLSLAAAPRGAVLVIHENRGLTDHIRSVADRLAGAGFTALAIDLVSEEGGTGAIADEGAVSGILANAGTDRLVDDMRAGLDELQRRQPGGRLGIIGFCFGGAMVWTLLDAGEPRLAAAIPFYGPGPEAPDFSGDTAAVMAVYAELDDRVNASQDRIRTALETAGLTHRMDVYPGVDHAFFNDTGGRYGATQAAAAWANVVDWFGTYLDAAGDLPSPGASAAG
jgi:carboxymethylenebutenolidase